MELRREMNFEDFVSKASRVMSADRPDLWSTPAEAEAKVRDWAYYITINPNDVYDEDETKERTIASGGYSLSRFHEDGFVEWSLSRQIVDYSYSKDEYTGHVDEDIFDWTDSSALLNV